MSFRRLLRRSPRELWTRGGQFIHVLLERSGKATLPSDGDVFEASFVAAPDKLLHHLRTRKRPRFFEGTHDLRSIRALFHSDYPREAESLLKRARNVQRGMFDLLGYHALDFGEPVNWHLDPISHREAPLAHWSRIPYLDHTAVGDHKVIWELNRQQYLITLGQAYVLTGDESYAGSVASYMTQWMEANPPKLGVNWASSLEVALRAVAWTWALMLVRDSPSLRPEFVYKAMHMLHMHAEHVRTYLSTYFSPNTHLTGEAASLIYLGTMFPELRSAAEWRRVGWQVLEKEVPRQVSPDGVYFEQSTHYQRYTIDFLIHVLLLDELNGGTRHASLKSILRGLALHLVYMQRPDGRTPSIGDEDGGRFVPLDNHDTCDHRGVFATAAILLGESACAHAARSLGTEALWLFGPTAEEKFGGVTADAPPLSHNIIFSQGGYCSFRSGWTPDADHAILDCGPHGALSHGHAHADALAVQLSVRGVPVLSDAGTFTYSEPVAREYFRSALAHSAITLDGLGASIGDPSKAFRWTKVSGARLCRSVSCSRLGYAEAEIAFPVFDDATCVRRELLFLTSAYSVLRDRAATRVPRAMQLHFHLSPQIKVELAGSSARLHNDEDIIATIICLASSGTTRFSCDEGWFSEVYGRREKCSHLILTAEPQIQHEIITVLLVGVGAVARLAETNGGAFQVTTRGYKDHLFIGPGAAETPSIICDAEWLWTRQRMEHSVPEELVALFASQLRLGVGERLYSGDRKSLWARNLDGSWNVTLLDTSNLVPSGL